VRLAWFSPLPPIPSGIADYSAELLPIIAEEADVDVFSPRARRGRSLHVPPGVSVSPPASFRRRGGSYDAVIYHLGNNPHHEFVYRAAMERPGITVFHELVLHHLIWHLHAERSSDWQTYRSILAEEHGEIGAGLAAVRGRGVIGAIEPFMFPLIAHVARRAKAIVVHSEDAREYVSEAAPGIPVSVIPHHAGLPPPQVEGLTRETARRGLGLPADAFLVGQFGFITVPKQPSGVLRGFARLLDRQPDAFLLLVGLDMTPGLALRDLVDSLGLTSRVRVTGFVDLPTFYRYLRAVDAVVNLRYPSAGEASGTFARALAEGRAVIVNDIGSFAEVPADVVLKVQVDGEQAEEVGRYLIRLAEDPGFKASIEEGARRYAATVLDRRRCAKLYLDLAREVAGERAAVSAT
jgi:glycosyltransferase involved in cell wall biosynthesis